MIIFVTYLQNEKKKQRIFKSRSALNRWEHEQENDVQILIIKELEEVL